MRHRLTAPHPHSGRGESGDEIIVKQRSWLTPAAEANSDRRIAAKEKPAQDPQSSRRTSELVDRMGASDRINRTRRDEREAKMKRKSRAEETSMATERHELKELSGQETAQSS